MCPSASLACLAPSPCTRLSRALSTYGRVRLPPPPQHLLPYGWSVQSAYSVRLTPRRDHGGSLGFHNASVSEGVVLQTPSQSPVPFAICGNLLLPSRFFDPVGLRSRLTRLNHFTCVTARSSPVPTLNSLRHLHESKARFPVGPCRCGNCTRWKRQAFPDGPKKLRISTSRVQFTFFRSTATHNASSASCWLRFGRKPYENPRKSSS